MQTIQLKRGALADLIALDPIPADGEIIIDTDSGNFKIGDGVRTWGALPYANISVNSLRAAQISDFNTAATNAVTIKLASTQLNALFDVSNAAPTTGDVLASISGAWTPTAPSALTPNMWVNPPASATASGTAGQIAYDGDYFYICVNADTWVRATTGTW